MIQLCVEAGVPRLLQQYFIAHSLPAATVRAIIPPEYLARCPWLHTVLLSYGPISPVDAAFATARLALPDLATPVQVQGMVAAKRPVMALSTLLHSQTTFQGTRHSGSY